MVRSGNEGCRRRDRAGRRRPVLWILGLLTLAVLAAAGGPAVGDSEIPDGGPLTLPQAVALARRQNPAVLESEAQTETARMVRREAGLSRLPALQIRETALRTTSPADAFGLQLMQQRFSFPSFLTTDPNRPDPLDNFSTEIEASAPLFTGGRLSAGIRQAGRMLEAAGGMRDHTVRAVELGVAEAYLDVLLADRFVELAVKARETTARHVETAEAFQETGMIVESDLLQARVQLARMQENEIRARNAADLARAGLNRAMGVPQDRRFELSEADFPSPPDASDPAAALASALQNRRDLWAVNRKVEAAEAGITAARGEYWPQIGVAARYVVNDSRFLGNHGDSYTLAAVADWKLWNWGQTQARVARSRSEHQAALQAGRSYRQQVEFEVRQAWQGVNEAKARLEVSTGAVNAAERALAILEDRFNQGVTRLTDLLDAETMAHEARVREMQARFDLQKADRVLSFATGHSPVPEVTP